MRVRPQELEGVLIGGDEGLLCRCYPAAGGADD